jgi:hypothetical protein
LIAELAVLSIGKPSKGQPRSSTLDGTVEPTKNTARPRAAWTPKAHNDVKLFDASTTRCEQAVQPDTDKRPVFGRFSRHPNSTAVVVRAACPCGLTVTFVDEPSSMNPAIQRAREFALQAHGNQRYGSHPYSYHLDAVADLLAPFGDEAQIAAYLHDTGEHTKSLSAKSLRRSAPPRLIVWPY